MPSVVEMAGGRPTLYDEKYIQKLLDYFGKPPYDPETNKPNDFPTLAGFAIELGISRDTLHEWSKVHEEFSDAYKRAKDFQERFLVINTLNGHYQQAFAIFTAKNVLGWRDKMDLEHTGPSGGPIQTEVIIVPSNGREPKD